MPEKSSSEKEVSTFSVRLDETRTKMLGCLMKKKGVKKNNIVNIAISEMFEREFPDKV